MSVSTNILSLVKRGTSDLPPRVLLAGPEGIGKTSFAAGAPSPLFIASEDGLTGFDHVQRFQPDGLDQLHQLLDALLLSPNGYRTLVVDTTDWLERLVHASICKRDGKSGVEDYGYGKGYVAAEEELVKLLAKFDTIRTKHSIGIILLGHVQITKFSDPRGSEWDRYSLKGNKKFTGILREWPDACLFAVREVFKTKDKNGSEKAITGERVVHTQWDAAWDAKNRLGLPETIELSWEAFDAAVKAGSPTAARARVLALYSTAKIPEDKRAKWEAYIKTIEGRSGAELSKAELALTQLQ